MNLFGANQPSPILFLVLYIWSLFWKGIALWRAAAEKQRNWFIALLIINSLGILEIIYLFKFSKKLLTIAELKSWLSRNRI